MAKNEPQAMGLTNGNSEAPDNMRDCKSVNNDMEKNFLGTDLVVESLAECPKATENICEVNTGSKTKKILKEIKVDEIRNLDQTKMDTASTDNLSEKNVNGKRKRRWGKKANNKDGTQSMDQVDGMITLYLSDRNHGEGVDCKRTEKEWTAQEPGISVPKGTALLPDVVEKLVPCESQLIIHPNLVASENLKTENGLNEVNGEVVVYKGKCSAEVSDRQESSLSDLIHGKENPFVLFKETVSLSDLVEVSSNRVSSRVVEERSEQILRPMEVDGKLTSCESQLSNHSNKVDAEYLKPESGSNKVNDEIVVYKGKCSAEGRSMITTFNVEVIQHLSSSSLNEEEWLSKDLGLYPRLAPTPLIKRKLIVLDVNGLLANIIMPAPKDCRGDTHILGRAIFRRPYCDDFLKFCFQNFDVGVWSSRSKRIIDRVVEYLLGDLTNKLLFCWDMSHSTQTGFSTLENIHKPLVFKELKKIWENDDSKLPWKNGDYNESNTLLLDDSPYKALLNPLHTAIFPNSYHFRDRNDNSLGPGGDLRVYLEELLASENVQKYVEQHPFGQSAINETNLSWGFYSGVLQTMSNQLQNTTPSSLPTLSSN